MQDQSGKVQMAAGFVDEAIQYVVRGGAGCTGFGDTEECR